MVAKNKPDESLSFDQAMERLLAVLPVEDAHDPWTTAKVAEVFWPGHDMSQQAAAAAASRFLRRAASQGRVRWTLDEWTGRYGWVRGRDGPG